MSISPFHGGLEFRSGDVNSDYPTQLQHVKKAVARASQEVEVGEDGFEERDMNEFFNPNYSNLSL